MENLSLLIVTFILSVSVTLYITLLPNSFWKKLDAIGFL